MTVQTQVIVYTTAISVLLTYAWWVHFRVWLLRQDLFVIRDALWDRMREEGMLDDPCHRQTRDGINSMIRLAPYLSLRVMALILASEVKIESPREPLPQEIAKARQKTLLRIFRFLFVETLSGLCLLFLVALLFLPVNTAIKQVQKWIGRIFDSPEVRTMEVSQSAADPLCLS